MDGKINAMTQQTKTPYVRFVTMHPNGHTYRTRARRYTHDRIRAIISEKQKKGFVCACIWSGHAIVEGELVNAFVVELDYEKWYHISAGLLPTEHPSTPYRVITRGVHE